MNDRVIPNGSLLEISHIMHPYLAGQVHCIMYIFGSFLHILTNLQYSITDGKLLTVDLKKYKTLKFEANVFIIKMYDLKGLCLLEINTINRVYIHIQHVFAFDIQKVNKSIFTTII